MSKKTTVSLGNALDIASVSELKKRFENALTKDLPVTLSANKVEKADTAGLQLAYAFVKKVEANGHDINWQSPSDVLVQTSEILGMQEHLNLS
ncbi:MAG: STAS domain-containing protein [Gammaproteobacteria bacterium]|nr:STAS domain-containing protein [Gammaproteobacteria bacterium]MDH5630075.1 STAS domain-containing protein [Gammaproteobacteria bacterium]